MPKKEIIITDKDRDLYLVLMRELVEYSASDSKDWIQRVQKPTLLKYVESPEKLSIEEKQKIKHLEPLIGLNLDASQESAKKRKAVLGAAAGAAGLGTAAATTAGALGIGSAAAGTASFIGGGALALGGLGAASIAAPLALIPFVGAASVLAVLSVKWFKTHKDEMQSLTNRAKEIKAKNEELIRKKADQIQANAAQLHQKMQEISKEYAQKAKESAKEFEAFMAETARHAAVNIDDLTHQNVNKRIQRYQEIALKQYRQQIEFERQLYELTLLYNKALAENEQLRMQIAELQNKIAAATAAEQSLSKKIKADKEA